MTADNANNLEISEVATLTGLSPATLRWYEREGLIPPVTRSGDGHRLYDTRLLRIITLIVRLRETGMQVSTVKEFCRMFFEGAATHGRRMVLLREHRKQTVAKLEQLQADIQMIDEKINHYDHLIKHGLDCDEHPITDPTILHEQRKLQ